MNKKFSTLVASVLLASSLGANAQNPFSVTSSPSVGSSPVAAYDETTKEGGYQVGLSYGLFETGGKWLSINEDGQLNLMDGLDVLDNLNNARHALWTLQQIISPEGAVAPKYVFMNDTTNQILAVTPGAAKVPADLSTSAVTVGGSQTEWLSAPAYKNPTDDNTKAYPIYAALSGDSIIALAKNANKVVLTKTEKDDLDNPVILQFKPYLFEQGFYLSANDLNTMLGAAGDKATASSYFSFSFDPVATVMGEDNLWTQDLQAVAVDRYELKYGEEAGGDLVSADYASLYPLRKKTSRDVGVSTVKAITDSDLTSFDNEETQYLAFKNRDNKYLVVDTTSIDGTGQTANLRMTFAMDGLFNAKNNTRFRNQKSYLFSVLYNPSTKDIKIETMGYFNAPKSTPDGADFTPSSYYNTYNAAASKEGAYWTGATTSATVAPYNTIIKAALGKTTEVTVGEVEPNSTHITYPSNEFVIKLGVSSRYQMTHLASGAYLIKVVASDNAERVGKYWINNLKGGFEIMEQAVRQNFQDMPAAQWIVTSTGTIDGSPVSITNREFESEGRPTDYQYSGILYREATYPANVATFSVGEDVLQFIPVEKANDPYLGYKYISDKDIDVTTFTFNYLHDLAMDKPINTKSDKDSVVWVDKDGNETKFVLEKQFDDAYGTNGSLAGVAKLTRRVYKVKVNDASKLAYDNRYLAYDADQKKYKVSEEGDLFFLKENNEVTDGECYYALVKANVLPVVKVDEDGEIASRTGDVVLDNDVKDSYVAEWGKYTNPNDGVTDGTEGWVIQAFDNEDDAKDAIAAYDVEGLVVKEVGTFAGQVDLSSVTAGKFVLAYTEKNANYATYKVSVDNNTLDLVNGVLNNNSAKEVATSAFATIPVSDPLYRRFNVEALGENADDAPNTLKFFRVNATDKEYLYEDAQSVYSKDKGFNFLGVEGKGDAKNAAIYVDTAYVDRGTKMPQYLLALRPEIVVGDTILCDATTHAHATVEEALACDHSKITPSYVDAWYLVNLQDSIDYYNDKDHKDASLVAKYQWNRQYTRLGFVHARHIGDTLVITNSVYTNNNQPITIGKAATWASKDSIFLGDNKHKNVVFSFRIAKSGSNDFLIESETEKDDKNVKNADLDAVKIAPMKGGWVKIQNGVPVIANDITYSEAGTDAEIFNVEATDEAPTANDAIATSEVSIVAIQGAVVVKNAAGKKVAISNILGQNIANAVLSSDNETIAAPAGIVVVAVEGEEAVKAVVK